MVKYYSTQEVEAMLGISKWTLREWLKDDNHPLVGVKMGRQWRISEEALNNYLKERHG